MRGALLALALALAPAAVPAQQDTLADIRQDLAVLYVEIQRLNRELSTTGGPEAPPAGGSVLERVDLIEQALQRLTARTEELEYRIARIVEDGTNRIGDMRFRLCEIDPGCDIADLGETPSLGGVETPSPEPPAAPDAGPELAVGEQEAFDAARAALEDGRAEEAAERFAAFAEAYPGGPLTARALVLRGDALTALGRTDAAARAYLDAFSGAPGGPDAPRALLALGRSLATLGQSAEACITLSEVEARFPESEEAAVAAEEAAALPCR